ncbi:hypothetical protein MMC10_008901 [Thelotrema lepadinum]|nr:hypothetical protein [Thelotrema lepadinum]
MPAFFEKHGYKDLTDSHDTIFNEAWSTKQDCFQWVASHPTKFENLNLYLASRRENQTTWVDLYPLSTSDLSSERALFVDVGRSIGHSCAEFKAKYPDLPGRVILQDLQFSIEHALPTAGVEKMVHDFTTPQPIKGAKYYYMRIVLHDWADDKCRVILGHIKDVLAPDSTILIDDIVAPNKGVNWQVSQLDLTMMMASASRERTESQWQDLFDSAGLKVVKRVVYTPGVYETVTAVVPE